MKSLFNKSNKRSLETLKDQFNFVENHQIIGYLEKVCGSFVGLRFPLNKGVTFIGRTEGRCEYTNREKLFGIVEGAQIYVKIENDTVQITDASSTNQSSLFPVSLLEICSWKELWKHRNLETKIEHERFETPLIYRKWYDVKEDEIISHLYGCWSIKSIV